MTVNRERYVQRALAGMAEDRGMQEYLRQVLNASGLFEELEAAQAAAPKRHFIITEVTSAAALRRVRKAIHELDQDGIGIDTVFRGDRTQTYGTPLPYPYAEVRDHIDAVQAFIRTHRVN